MVVKLPEQSRCNAIVEVMCALVFRSRSKWTRWADTHHGTLQSQIDIFPIPWRYPKHSLP